nr:response regulator [Brevibacillus composti]
MRSTTSAKEALELLNTERWDLLITDVMMPQMSGYELTRRVRTRFAISELPVLLLTARNQPADIYAGSWRVPTTTWRSRWTPWN